MLKLPFLNKKFKLLIFTAAFVFAALALLFHFYQKQQKQEETLLFYEETLATYKEQFGFCYYEDYAKAYETVVGNYEAALAGKDIALLEKSHLELEALWQTIVKENTLLFEKNVKRLKKADISNAYDNERTRLAEIESEIQSKIEDCQFTAIPPLLEEWSTLLGNMSFVADNLSIYVNQVDASRYPLIDLYLSIHDIQKDQVPSYLVKNYFYLTEALDANAPGKAEVIRMEQMDGNGALNIALVSDLSHVYRKKEKKKLQRSLTGFLKQMQFDVGDQVEFIASSRVVSIAADYTSNSRALLKALPKLTRKKGSSHLYDGIFTALNRSAAKQGAKCVIALSDGEDTKSRHTWEEIVALACEYNIPVYVIGIGKEVSPYVLERIGAKTNGFYRNINDFSSLKDIFATIYEKQKSLYRIQYKSAIKEPPYKRRNLEIAYQNRLFGGNCSFSFSPSIVRPAFLGETEEEKKENQPASPSQVVVHDLETNKNSLDSLNLLSYKISKETYNRRQTRCKISITGIYASSVEIQPYELTAANITYTLEKKDGAWLIAESDLR